MVADNKIVFMLFYAIAWGIVANVQGRWKAFHWPLVHKVKQAKRRTVLSFVCFNLLPFFFFAYVLWVLEYRGQSRSDLSLIAIPALVIQAMLPSLGVFGFYRIWLGTIERYPTYFYETKSSNLDEEFRHLEPTIRFKSPDAVAKTPVIDIGRHTSGPNLFWGAVYLLFAALMPWVRL